MAALLLLASSVAFAAAAPPVPAAAAAAVASHWSASWLDGGFWRARPWVWGWYRVHPEVWSWWPSSAAAWGVSGLTPAVALTELVNDAITRQATVIALPRTDLSLDFGSVQAQRPMGARFLWRSGESLWNQATADCQAGLLNGMPPQAAAGAALLNAACQVAYGAP